MQKRLYKYGDWILQAPLEDRQRVAQVGAAAVVAVGKPFMQLVLGQLQTLLLLAAKRWLS